MTYMRATLVVGAILFFSSCGTDPNEAVTLSSTLRMTPASEGGGLLTGLPAKVSLFFSLDKATGEPVSGLGASAFDLFEDGRRISPYESQLRISPKGERFRTSSLLLLDMSGSILRSGGFPALRNGAAAYISEVLKAASDGQRIALATFDGRAAIQLLSPFSSDSATLLAALDSLQTKECNTASDCATFEDRKMCAAWRCVDDSTNLNGAVVGGLDVLAKQVAEVGIAYHDTALVVFTDGTDQAARIPQASMLQTLANSTSHVFTVGLGGDVDASLMQRLGRDGSFFATASADLLSAFQRVARAITAKANRFYALEYCSPKRAGRHELKVTTTLRDGPQVYTGTMTREFDASGFTSGCTL